MTSPTPDPYSRKLADLMLDFDRRIARMESGQRAAQLGYSSIEDSYVAAYDSLGQARQRIGRQTDGTFSIVYTNGSAPPVPSGVNIAAGQLALVVQWDGSFDGGAQRPNDFMRLDIHMSETEGFTPTAETIRASLFDIGAVSFFADSDTKYIRTVAVNNSGVPSAATDELAILPLPADQIAAGAIGAQQLAAEIVLANIIIVGNPTAARFELNGSTNEVSGYANDGSTRTLLFDADTGNVYVVGEYRSSESGDAFVINRDSIFPMTMTWEFDGELKRSEITAAVDGSGDPTIVLYTANDDGTVANGTRIIQSSTSQGARMDWVNSNASVVTSEVSISENSTIRRSRVNWNTASERHGTGTAANVFTIVDSSGVEYTSARLEHVKMYTSPVRGAIRNTVADLAFMLNSTPNPSEFTVLNASGSAFRPVRASAFLTASSTRGKRNIKSLPFTALEVVKNAPVTQWEYIPTPEMDIDTTDENGNPKKVRVPAEKPVKHVGPMAEDLPSSLVVRPDEEDAAIDLRDMIGVLWAAVQEVNTKLDELQESMDELGARVSFIEIGLS